MTRAYNKKSSVKRGRKKQEWKPIELSSEVPIMFAGEKCGWIWVNHQQKPFSEWQELKDGTVNVKLNTEKFGHQFINICKTDIHSMPQ